MRRFIILTALTLLLIPISSYAQTDDTSIACEDGFRLFDHEYLATEPVCVPENPERVIALDLASLELLQYTDIEVVGSASWILDEYAAMLPEMEEYVAGIPDVGYPVNLEAALTAEPDMILAYAAEDNIIDFEQGSEIAPVVSTTLTIDDWERTTQFWAEALNVQPVFEEMQATYDARIENLQDAIDLDPSETEVSLVTANSYGVNIWLEDSPQGKILDDVGFARPESQAIAGDVAIDEYGTRQYAIISDETLNLADGDIIYLFNYATADPELRATEEATVSEFRQGALWQQLDAVQDDNTYVVGTHWYRAGTFLLSNRVIDDLFATLTDTDPETIYTDLLPDDFSQSEEASAACDNDMRAVTDALGEQVCVPENPERIIGLMEADIDALLALGITPVGVTNGRGQLTPPRYLEDRLDGVTSVGRFYSPNLETILELEPDLILFGGFTDEAVLAQLNAIAPTVNTLQFGESWQSHFRRVGEVLNRTDEADTFIAEYDARIADMQDELGANADDSFIVGRWTAEGPQIMAPTLTFSSGILLDLGLEQAPEIPELQDGHPHSAPLSLESLELLDVDWAFLGTLGTDDDTVSALEDALDNPLFQALDVAQNDRVVIVDGSLWTSVGGPLAAMQVLDDVEVAMLGED